jgi:hypothetical protein
MAWREATQIKPFQSHYVIIKMEIIYKNLCGCFWGENRLGYYPSIAAGFNSAQKAQINVWLILIMPIPVVTRSVAWVCGRLVAGIAGSNTARGMDISLLCLYVVLSCVGRGLWDGLITRTEESYRVSVCVWSQKPRKGPYVPVGNLMENDLNYKPP